MADLAPIDPDLEQVIADLSKDPRASLFLTEPRKLLCGLRDGSLQVAASRTGLLPAEEKLLEVHRHEMAWLLREAFLSEFFAHPASARNRRVMTKSRQQLEGIARDRLAALPEALQNRPEVLVLERFIRPRGEPTMPSRMRLLWASLELEDAPNARAYLVFETCALGQFNSAVRLGREVAAEPHSPRIRASALGTVGMALTDLRRPAEALAAYKEAASIALAGDLDPSISVEYLLNVVYLDLQLGDGKDVHEAASVIADLDQLPKRRLEDAANRVRTISDGSQWTLPPKRRELALQLADNVGPFPRECLHALL